MPRELDYLEHESQRMSWGMLRPIQRESDRDGS